MAATAAGERISFEARDPPLIEPCAEGFAGGGRAEKDRDRGFEEHVDCCQAGGNGNLHGDRIAKLAGWRKAAFDGALAVGGSPPGGLHGRRASGVPTSAAPEPERARKARAPGATV